MKIKYHWGICSTGAIANKFATALHSVENAICYAVSSRTQEKADAFCTQHQFIKAYGDYQQMLADPKVDIVYIASPMACHYNDALAALKAGKHVLCEKTVTMCTDDWIQLTKIAKEKHLFLMEAMWMKCRPTFQQALSWAKEGKIGTVKLVKADFCNIVPFIPQSRLFRSDLGGGALLDLGVYPFTLAEAFLEGEVQHIDSTAYIGETLVDYDMGALITYPNGTAILSAGFNTTSPNTATIVGTDGRIEMGSWFLSTCETKLYGKNGSLIASSIIPDRCNGYEYEIEEVHHCLENGLLESALVPHAGTTAVMQQIDLCRKQWGTF